MSDATACIDCEFNIGSVVFMDETGVDRCVRPELEMLWNKDIETSCSCCGHGKPDDAYIVVKPEYRQQMIDLGYEEIPPKEDSCTKCGVFFRAKLTEGFICPEFEEYPEWEGVSGNMFDVKPVTSPKLTDCGTTCLKMLLDYYGIDVPIDELNKECHTRIAGSSGKDLNECGRKHGLDMKAFKMDAEELVKQDRPGIIWWRYNHWVVFCGQDETGKVVICNPDKGRYRMSFGTFKSFYTEVGLFNGEPQDLPEDDVA